jgi:hypothetical protein
MQASIISDIHSVCKLYNVFSYLHRNTHARLSRFLSYRQAPGSATATNPNHPGTAIYRPHPRSGGGGGGGTAAGGVEQGRISPTALRQANVWPLQRDGFRLINILLQ